MARVYRRESARRDLLAQWVWYAENSGVGTADRFLAAAQSAAAWLADLPESGRRLDSTEPALQNVRRFPLPDGFEAILLFYIPRPDGIEIIRVLRGSRDLTRLLSDSD